MLGKCIELFTDYKLREQEDAYRALVKDLHFQPPPEPQPKGSIYIIGSLRNSEIPKIGAMLRHAGWDAFDDWHAAGPEADDCWQRYENGRGRNYREALAGWAAGHVFEFDLKHLNRCDAGLLVLPAGKSGHLEIGYMLGQGKRGYILLDGEPERYDVMYRFATKVFTSREDMTKELCG